MKEILKFIEESDCIIVADWIDKQTFACIFFEDFRIILNIPLLVVDSFIHEFMHYKYAYLGERTIIRKTDKKIQRLTVKQIHEIFGNIMGRIKADSILGGNE